jgi:hypothetical protein
MGHVQNNGALHERYFELQMIVDIDFEYLPTFKMA